MANIFEDIVNDIPIKESKTKKILKWVIRIGILLIFGAFILGQIKIKSINKVNNFEKTLQENTQAVKDLKQETETGFNAVNKRIDKVYDDGNKVFNDFQDFNLKQLGLIIDYGQSNKDMLKRMLDLNMNEKSKTVENQLEQAKTVGNQQEQAKSKTLPKDSLNVIIKPVDKKNNK
jgi:hypothetical protein